MRAVAPPVAEKRLVVLYRGRLLDYLRHVFEVFFRHAPLDVVPPVAIRAEHVGTLVPLLVVHREQKGDLKPPLCAGWRGVVDMLPSRIREKLALGVVHQRRAKRTLGQLQGYGVVAHRLSPFALVRVHQEGDASPANDQPPILRSRRAACSEHVFPFGHIPASRGNHRGVPTRLVRLALRLIDS